MLSVHSWLGLSQVNNGVVFLISIYSDREWHFSIESCILRGCCFILNFYWSSQKERSFVIFTVDVIIGRLWSVTRYFSWHNIEFADPWLRCLFLFMNLKIPYGAEDGNFDRLTSQMKIGYFASLQAEFIRHGSYISVPFLKHAAYNRNLWSNINSLTS